MSENSPQIEENDEASLSHDKFKWFAVSTQSGMEKKAKFSLEERIKKLKMEEFFGKILIPSQQVDRIDQSGKKKRVEQKMMPGYLFIQMDPDNDAVYSCVKGTPKISSFIGASNNQKPKPVPNEEISRLVNRMIKAPQAQSAKPLVAFEKGEKVKVIDGPFTNFIGDIDEVKVDKMKLRLLISVFGRATPVEIEFNKVEKIKNEG
ncbi:MAG: transcription termination/antitermination protein NusG [Silvanigrellaceae bacterium]|nr:transcription termination/antitermination protein NusG [Silvanigrellaceae bacterium]